MSEIDTPVSVQCQRPASSFRQPWTTIRLPAWSQTRASRMAVIFLTRSAWWATVVLWTATTPGLSPRTATRSMKLNRSWVTKAHLLRYSVLPTE